MHSDPHDPSLNRIAPLDMKGDAPESLKKKTIEVSIEDLQRVQEAANHAQRDQKLLRERLTKQFEERVRYAVEPLVLDLLVAIDALDQGINQTTEEAAQTGMRHVLQQIVQALQAHDVHAIMPNPGDPVDPRYHEVQRSTAEQGLTRPEVRALLRPGFRLHERVIRAAMVEVATPENPCPST